MLGKSKSWLNLSPWQEQTSRALWSVWRQWRECIGRSPRQLPKDLSGMLWEAILHWSWESARLLQLCAPFYSNHSAQLSLRVTSRNPQSFTVLTCSFIYSINKSSVITVCWALFQVWHGTGNKKVNAIPVTVCWAWIPWEVHLTTKGKRQIVAISDYCITVFDILLSSLQEIKQHNCH